MNSYLLLRDNKKSGPYTAEELSAMGLKAYDLVWLEGKSAAWRYPGEMDELKSFAPAVEEQPYDRFYKKPDSQNRYAPRTSFETGSTRTSSRPGSKVYVRVPQNSSSKTSRSQEKREMSPVNIPLNNLQDSSPVHEKTIYNPVQHAGDSSSIKPAELSGLPFPERQTAPELKIDHTRVVKNPGSRIHPLWITALVLLGGLSIFLYINYRQQNKRLNQLSNLVLDMQQAQPPAGSPYNKNVAALLPDRKPSHSLEDSLLIPVQTAELTPVEASEKISLPPKKKSGKKTQATKDSVSQNMVPEVDSPIIDNRSQETETSIKPKPTESSLRSRLDLSANDYKIGLFGGVSNLELTLSNKSSIDLKKVEVQIEYLGPDQKVLREQTINFQDLMAGKTSTEKVPKSGRGVSVRFHIKSIDPV